jgi:putative restriction endonuclease
MGIVPFSHAVVARALHKFATSTKTVLLWEGRPLTREDVLRRFENLNVWQKHGHRAPHKPLLILYALGRWKRGLTDLSFREAEKDLKELLREFGPDRKRDHPEEPFWRLQHDDDWTVHAPEGLALKAGRGIPTVTELRSHNVKAEFSGDVRTALANDQNLLGEIARRILEQHFDANLHQRILTAVGLRLSPGSRTR